MGWRIAARLWLKSCLSNFQTENQENKVQGSPNLRDSNLIRKTQELQKEVGMKDIQKNNLVQIKSMK